MDPHEQPQQNVDQYKMARQAANETMAKIKAIDESGSTSQEQKQQKSEIGAETIREFLRHKERLDRLNESEKTSGSTDELKEKIKIETQNIGLTLVKACTLASNKIQMPVSPKAQGIIDELSKNPLADYEAITIQNILGDYLLGVKTNSIIISKPNEARSDFIKSIDNLIYINPAVAEKFIHILMANASEFGMTAQDIANNFIPEGYEGGVDPLNQQKKQREYSKDRIINNEVIQAGIESDYSYYQTTFTQEQLKLIETFYSPTAFVEHIKFLGKTASDGTTDQVKVMDEKNEIREKIIKHHEKKHQPVDLGTLEIEVEKHWGEKVSEKMKDEVQDLVNHLFLVLQTKASHQFYDEVLQHTDPFFGPPALLNKMQNALRKLMTTTAEIEKKSDNNDARYREFKKLDLYVHQEEDQWVDERELDADGHGKLYPRIRPISNGKKVSVNKYVENLNMLMDHTTHSDEFFHNGRAIYKHPAGEKGFYQQLGEFAEKLSGTDIDEILMLPNGQYVLQAYQLYEKFLKEDFSSIDWHHRPDQFQQELESVNSKLENELIANMQAFYPELSEMKVRSIVNNAIGISRSLTLSEPETSSYADAIDAEGHGMVASYSTNDAASLNVFNSLHNSLRWQGEHNWNLMYFMPVEGRKGMWKHTEARDNMAKFMNSLVVGHGRGDLPKLFVDVLTDINKVGGAPGKRKGWRSDYSFDGHVEYDNKYNTVKHFETFRAMEAIGYEGIAYFVETNKAGKGLMQSTEGDQMRKRMEFFKYIYKRYIYEGDSKNFNELEFNNYLKTLSKAGEERALRYIRGQSDEGSDHVREKGKPIINGSWEEQVTYATSQIFMESTLAHYTAAKMPTIFLKIGRNRFTKEGLSSRELAFRDLDKTYGWGREKFDSAMKNFGLAEMLFRRQISGEIREEMSFDDQFKLSQIDTIKDLPHRLDSAKIRELLSKNSKGGKFKSSEEIETVVKLWEYMKKEFFKKGTDGKAYLDEKAFKELKDYPFTIGLEDTDMSLVAYRGTGPRMIARSIKDIGGIEQAVTPWLMNMPAIMADIAVNGKHDIGPLIEYMLKAKKAINDVHGSEAAHEFAYKVSGGVINYFKKDGLAKPIFGLFRFGKINSNAGEYASSSSAVWEWESKEVERFGLALRSYNILPGEPYDKNKTEMNPVTGKVEHVGGKWEDVWWINPITKKPFKTIFRKRHVDFEYNFKRLMKEHGGDWKAIGWDYINKYIPIFLIALLFKYLKDAIDEMTGKKK